MEPKPRFHSGNGHRSGDSKVVHMYLVTSIRFMVSRDFDVSFEREKGLGFNFCLTSMGKHGVDSLQVEREREYIGTCLWC